MPPFPLQPPARAAKPDTKKKYMKKRRDRGEGLTNPSESAEQEDTNDDGVVRYISIQSEWHGLQPASLGPT